jgi:hypothetical protein
VLRVDAHGLSSIRKVKKTSTFQITIRLPVSDRNHGQQLQTSAILVVIDWLKMAPTLTRALSGAHNAAFSGLSAAMLCVRPAWA